MAIAFRLAASAEHVRLRIWSKGLMLLIDLELGAGAAGWNRAGLPADFARQAANDVYFYTLEAQAGDRHSPVARGTLNLLR